MVFIEAVELWGARTGRGHLMPLTRLRAGLKTEFRYVKHNRRSYASSPRSSNMSHVMVSLSLFRVSFLSKGLSLVGVIPATPASISAHASNVLAEAWGTIALIAGLFRAELTDSSSLDFRRVSFSLWTKSAKATCATLQLTVTESRSRVETAVHGGI